MSSLGRSLVTCRANKIRIEEAWREVQMKLIERQNESTDLDKRLKDLQRRVRKSDEERRTLLKRAVQVQKRLREAVTR
jgi:chromosome segregation ATPase